MRKKLTIIGGGLAGMSAAIRLSQHYEVTILEKGERLGGKLNKREGKGYTFDTGPSILTMPWVLEKLFADVGKNIHDYIQIVRVEPGWRTFFSDGTTVDLTSDLPTMLEEIKKVSPADAQNLFPYLTYTSQMYELMQKSFYKKNISGLQDIRMEHTLRDLWQMDPMKTMDQSTQKYFSHPKIQQLMNFLIMYIGSSPYHAPAVLSQLAHVQLGIGVHYVQGGMYNIAIAMESLLRELGVTVHLNSKVVRVETNAGNVTAVHTEDGKKVDTELLVSNLEVIPFYDSLSNEPKAKEHVQKDLAKFEPTVSGLVMLLGVNKVYDQLKHHNFFFSEDPKKEFRQVFDEKVLADDPTIYLGISSKTDPSQAPEGKDNIFVLTHVPPLKEGETWEKYKDTYRELVLNKLEKMGLTGLRESIEFEYIFTPDDLKELYGANGGSIYGVVTDRKLNGGFKIPSRSKIYDNVYFVGGSTHPGGGVPMVTLSGQLTADLILAEQAQKDIRIG